MAKGSGETVSGLYLRLGLNYDELNQDFVKVEETLSSNIQRLNRQSTLIDLKAKVDLTGVTDAEQRLKIQSEALTKQVEIQTQKVKLYETEWLAAGKAHGNASQQAQKAAIALKSQELALARLTQRLKEVQDAQNALPKNDNSLLAGYNGLKGNVAETIGNLTNAFSGIKDATSSADAAITKSLEIIGNIPSPVGKAVAALASIPLIAKGIESSLLNLAKPAIAAGDSLYVMSRGMQLSISDASKLNTIAKVTGIEINEVNSAMRRLSASLEKAGDKDNAAMKMLQKFGANVKSANGHIKNEIELIGEVATAFKRAQAAGQGAAFRDIVGGRFWSGDLITFFEDYEGNVELAGKIVKNGLANPALAHEVQGNLNAMNTQLGQLKSALSSAFIPATQQLVPQLTEQFGELTKVIADNAEGIKNVSMVIGEVIGYTSKLTTEIAKLAVKSTQLIVKPPKSAIVDKYKDDSDIKSLDDLINKELQEKYNGNQAVIDNISPRERFALVKYYEPIWQELDEIYKTTREKVEQINEEFTKLDPRDAWSELKGDKITTFEDRDAIRKSNEDLQNLSDELYKIRHNSYENALFDVKRWYEDLINAESTTAEQRAIIEELYTEKVKKLENEKVDEIKKATEESQKRAQDLMREAVNISGNLSPFEQQIQSIKQWEQTAFESLSKYQDALKDTGQLEQEAAAIAANSLAKQREAFEREIDRIQGKIQSLGEKIFEQEHSQRDIDIMRAQKQRADFLKEGVYPKEMVDRWYQNELAKIRERTVDDKGGNYTKNPQRYNSNAVGFQMMYGDEPEAVNLPVKDFFGDLQRETSEATNNFLGLSQSTQELSDAQSSLAQSFQLIEGDAIVSSFTTSVNGVVDAQDYFAQATEDAGNSLANALQEVEQRIKDNAAVFDNLQRIQQQQSSLPFDVGAAKAAADIVGTTGEAVALAGGATLNPMVALGGGLAALLGNTVSKGLDYLDDSPQPDFAGGFNTSELNTTLQDIHNDWSQILSDISQNVQQIVSNKTPNITVSPNINIDLGGAYVFDNEMKGKLTDDIVSEVANAIRDAVQSEVSSASYGYGN